MSVTFQAGWMTSDGTIRPLVRCYCSARFLQACDKADLAKTDYPPPYHCSVCDSEMNLANTNAMDLLNWLGLPAIEYGSAPASDVAAKCRRRLWDEARNVDEGKPMKIEGIAIFMARDPGYLREKTELLLKIAETAGSNLVIWA